MSASDLDLITTNELTVGYPGDRHSHPVASYLSLTVSSGELVCLLGPNGAGKSTLLRTLAGMQPPLSGGIQMNQRPLEQLSAAQRATQLSVVLTELPAANLTVYDLVAMGRYPYTGWLGRLSLADRQAITHAMTVTDITHFADRPVGTLSDGERQRVMIARAVAQDTPLLILDEPTAHLDVPNRTAVLQLLRTLAHEQQKAVLLSTHALDLALLMADRLWLMHEGQILTGVPEDLVLDGTLAKVFEQPGVSFDAHTGTFKIAREGGQDIGLAGEIPAVFWTRRALERTGYTVVSTSANVPSVHVSDQPPRWTIQYRGNSVEVDTIAAVLARLTDLLNLTE